VGHRRIWNAAAGDGRKNGARSGARKAVRPHAGIQRLIGRSLRAVTDQEALGERTVWLDCDVIEADAEHEQLRSTGAFVALALAMERMVAAGILKNSPLIDTVAATSVGIVEDVALLILCTKRMRTPRWI